MVSRQELAGTRQFGSYPDNYAGLGGAIGHSDTLNQHWDVPNMRLPLPSWYHPVHVMRGDMIELNQLAPTLAKLSCTRERSPGRGAIRRQYT